MRADVCCEAETVREVRSVEELDRVLDELTEGTPRAQRQIVVVVRQRGDSLSFGVFRGVEETVLSYAGVDGQLPYYAGVGRPGREGTLSFRFGGQWSEFSLRHAIPVAQAREAVRRFVATPGLPANVEWTGV